MIKRADELKDAITFFVDNEKSRVRCGVEKLDSAGRSILQNELDKEDWDILHEYSELLEPFEDATEVLQGNPGTHPSSQNQKQGLAASVLLAFEFLLSHLEASKVNYQSRPEFRHLSIATDLAWDKCNEYYKKLDDTPVYLAGVILHPSHKWGRLEELWGNSKKAKRWIQDGKTRLKAFWESEYKSRPISASGTASIVEGAKGKQSKFEIFLQGRRQNTHSSSCKDEYEEWCQMPRFEHPNALVYWIDNRSRWPNLARMGIDIFSIPAMSAEPERIFSNAGDMCTSKRVKLKAESIQACQCLRSWDNAGIIDSLFKQCETEGEHANADDLLESDELANVVQELSVGNSSDEGSEGSE